MVSGSVFAPAESPYSHTSDALWTLWCVHDRTYSSAVLSGTWAPKPGYHGKRADLPSDDYSSGRDVRNDDYGPGDMTAGEDVSMNPSDMKTWTKRLKNAATSNDPRLKFNGEWILREFIGTLDGVTVYCWVFTGGVPLGVGADSGPDPGRDKSHLWHGHLSVIRKFLNHMAALQQIASIVSGETLDQWRTRMQAASEEDELNSTQDKNLAWTTNRVNSTNALTEETGFPDSSKEPNRLVAKILDFDRRLAGLETTVAEIKALMTASGGSPDVAAILTGVAEIVSGMTVTVDVEAPAPPPPNL